VKPELAQQAIAVMSEEDAQSFLEQLGEFDPDQIEEMMDAKRILNGAAQSVSALTQVLDDDDEDDDDDGIVMPFLQDDDDDDDPDAEVNKAATMAQLGAFVTALQQAEIDAAAKQANIPTAGIPMPSGFMPATQAAPVKPASYSNPRITEINKQSLAWLREVIGAVFEQVETLTGVKVELGNAKFTSKNGTFANVHFAIVDQSTGVVLSREAQDFKRLAHTYLMEPTDLSEAFEYNSEDFIITGCNPRNSKLPILAERIPDGKKFKFPAHIVARAITNRRIAQSMQAQAGRR
jgi:hypothetical protein